MSGKSLQVQGYSILLMPFVVDRNKNKSPFSITTGPEYFVLEIFIAKK